MRTDRRLLVLFSLLASWPALAREIHYGAVSHPALDACDRMAWRGQIDASRTCYRELFGSDAPAAIRAEAAWALNDLPTANTLFRQAAAVMPGDAAIRARWGDLYADSHQDGDAMVLYGEALAIDSQHAYALLGAARLLVGGFDD